MKKFLIILAFVAVLICASIWYVVSRYGISDSAAIVPAEAVVFVALPDMVQTSIRWHQTSLAKIGAEPAMQEFLERPLSLLGQEGIDEATGILSRLKPGRAFIAVNNVTETAITAVLGFQFFGGKKDYEEAIARLHTEVLRVSAGATRSEEVYGGDTITKITNGDMSMFTGSNGSWGFVSNDLASIQNAMDRAAGRDATPSLADSESFRSVRAKLTGNAEVIWYAATAPLIDLLLTIGEEQDAAIDPAQLAQVRKVTAIGGSLAFQGADQVERIFMLWEEMPATPTIDRSGLGFTSPEDILFMETAHDWSTLTSNAYTGSLPPQVLDFLSENQIDLSEFPNQFGSDSVLVANWPSGAMFPTALLAVAVKDRQAVEAMTRRLVEKFAPTATISERQDATVFEFPVAGLGLIDPAVAVSSDYMIAAITTASINNALARNPGTPTLEKVPAFASVSSEWHRNSQNFIYIDTQTIFDRVYNTMRPMIIFGAAMSPDVAKTIDIQKLPETEIISKHLGPIVMTQHAEPDGWMIESRGPVTLYQTFMLAGAGMGFGAAANLLMVP